MKMEELIIKSKKLIEEADVVLIGAGAGLSSSAGLTYSGERFRKHFSEFINKYKITDMYSAVFYPYKTLEEKWGYLSEHIYQNRYSDAGLALYKVLLEIVGNKDYFVITTNVDGQFEKVGFNKEKIFEVQGNYGEIQCSVPCHNKVYSNKEIIFEMRKQRKDLKIPTNLIPKCPRCNAEMTTHLRVDNLFVQTEEWYKQQERYYKFLEKNQNKKIVLLELGVGFNTPTIIKFPFERLNKFLDDTKLIRVNKENYFKDDSIITIKEDIKEVFEKWKS